MDVRDSEDDTLLLGDFTQELFDLLNPPTPVHQDRTLVDDALELASDLWPRPRNATVTLETHQWLKLRRLLLAVPALWVEANT